MEKKNCEKIWWKIFGSNLFSEPLFYVTQWKSRISPFDGFHFIFSVPKNPSPQRLYCVNGAFHVKEALHRD